MRFFCYMDKDTKLKYNGKYILEHVTNLESFDFDFGLVYLPSSRLGELDYLKEIESKIKSPHIIITEEKVDFTENLNNELLVDIICQSDCNKKVDSIMLKYFIKENNKGTSIVELVDIINSVERIEDNIIIQVKSNEKLAVIIIENGRVIKVKSNQKDVSTVKELLKWKNNLIKLKKMNKANLSKIEWFLNR